MCVCVFTPFFLGMVLTRATLVSELVERGEKMLRDGLASPNSNPSKLNDSICAQLCVAGLEAMAKATRYDGFFYEQPAALSSSVSVESSISPLYGNVCALFFSPQILQ